MSNNTLENNQMFLYLGYLKTLEFSNHAKQSFYMFSLLKGRNTDSNFIA